MENSVNTFEGGLVTDFNPSVVPENNLTDVLNGTLITMNGNELVLQNEMGNAKVEGATLPDGYVPVGIKEHGGIIYIASYNPLTNKSQIGSFPSPERNLTKDSNSNLQIEYLELNMNSYTSVYLLISKGISRGDKFIIMPTNNTDVSEWFSKISNFNNSILDEYKIISPKNNIMTYSVKVLSRENELIDITNQLKRYDSNGNVINLESKNEQLMFNSGSFIYPIEQNPDESKYNIYNNTFGGTLYLEQKYNTIDHIEINTYLQNGDPLDLDLYNNTIFEITYYYNCPDGITNNLNGIAVSSTEELLDTSLYSGFPFYIAANSSGNVVYPIYDQSTNLYIYKNKFRLKYLIAVTISGELQLLIQGLWKLPVDDMPTEKPEIPNETYKTSLGFYNYSVIKGCSLNIDNVMSDKFQYTLIPEMTYSIELTDKKVTGSAFYSQNDILELTVFKYTLIDNNFTLYLGISTGIENVGDITLDFASNLDPTPHVYSGYSPLNYLVIQNIPIGHGLIPGFIYECTISFENVDTTFTRLVYISDRFNEMVTELEDFGNWENSERWNELLEITPVVTKLFNKEEKFVPNQSLKKYHTIQSTETFGNIELIASGQISVDLGIDLDEVRTYKEISITPVNKNTPLSGTTYAETKLLSVYEMRSFSEHESWNINKFFVLEDRKIKRYEVGNSTTLLENLSGGLYNTKIFSDAPESYYYLFDNIYNNLSVAYLITHMSNQLLHTDYFNVWPLFKFIEDLEYYVPYKYAYKVDVLSVDDLIDKIEFIKNLFTINFKDYYYKIEQFPKQKNIEWYSDILYAIPQPYIDTINLSNYFTDFTLIGDKLYYKNLNYQFGFYFDKNIDVEISNYNAIEIQVSNFITSLKNIIFNYYIKNYDDLETFISNSDNILDNRLYLFNSVKSEIVDSDEMMLLNNNRLLLGIKAVSMKNYTSDASSLNYNPFKVYDTESMSTYSYGKDTLVISPDSGITKIEMFDYGS